MKNVLVALLVALGGTSANAVPVSYDYNYRSELDVITGVFTLNLGDALGTYEAESFSGMWRYPLDPRFDAPWTRVAFEAVEGEGPALIINGPNSGIRFNMPAVGGGRILPGSSAILEWEQFLTEIEKIPWLRGVITTSPVPDNGPPATAVAAVLAGLFLVNRKLRARV
jgi:hypothetical protein